MNDTAACRTSDLTKDRFASDDLVDKAAKANVGRLLGRAKDTEITGGKGTTDMIDYVTETQRLNLLETIVTDDRLMLLTEA